MSPTDQSAQRLAFVVPALLLAGAYVSQYGFGLFPCEMCWWQRWPLFAAVGLAALSFIAPPQKIWPKRLLIAMAAGGIFTSGLIGGFHAGVEYDWWEGITGCAIPLGNGGSALETILAAPLVRCDEAPWTMLGISLAGFNFLISCSSALAICVLLAKKDKR